MRDEKPVTPKDLRYLLGQITYHFMGDQKLMRKARTMLLRLIREFSKEKLKEWHGGRRKK